MTHRSVTPFKRWHLEWLLEEDQSAEGDVPKWPVELVYQMEKMSTSWTLHADGIPLGCGGFIPLWPGRHQAWMFVNKNAGPYMKWITKQVKDKIKQIDGRIEMTVRADFERGNKWAKILGFEVETQCLKHYGPYGEDHVGYVLLNGDM